MKKHTPSRYTHLSLPEDRGWSVRRLIDKKTGATILVKEADVNPIWENTTNTDKPGVIEFPSERQLVLEFQIPLNTWNTAALTKTFLKLWQEIKTEKLSLIQDSALRKQATNEYVKAYHLEDNKAAQKALRKLRNIGPVIDALKRQRKLRIVDNTKRDETLKKEYTRLRKKRPYETHRAICRMVQERFNGGEFSVNLKNAERILEPCRPPRRR